jgi:hypothetical protein
MKSKWLRFLGIIAPLAIIALIWTPPLRHYLVLSAAFWQHAASLRRYRLDWRRTVFTPVVFPMNLRLSGDLP